MKSLHDLKEILDEQIKKIARKGDINPSELEAMYKAVDIIKDIATIDAMDRAEKDEERGESRNEPRHMHDGYSYTEPHSIAKVHETASHDGAAHRYPEPYPYYYMSAPMHGEHSERRGRDAMGRFTSREMRYSRAEAKDKMIEKLEKMMDGTTSAKEREVIRTAIEELER